MGPHPRSFWEMKDSIYYDVVMFSTLRSNKPLLLHIFYATFANNVLPHLMLRLNIGIEITQGNKYALLLYLKNGIFQVCVAPLSQMDLLWLVRRH